MSLKNNDYLPLENDEIVQDTETQTNTLLNDGTSSVFTEFTATTRDLDTIETTKIGTYSILVVCCSAVGGMLFGFDTAIISSCLLFIKEDLGHQLTALEKEIITSITSMTALLGSIIAGFLADKFGRKFVLTACCVVFIISAIIMGFANSVWLLVFGRGIVGIAVGGASMVVPVFISEIAPSKYRGTLLALNSISTTGGQLIAYLLANSLKNITNNWRISFFLSSVPPILFLLVVKFIPETPRFSIANGNIKDAQISLSKIFPSAQLSQVEDKINLIQQDIINSTLLQKKTRHFWEPIIRRKSTKNALIVGCILMATQGWVGFNAFMYYSTLIFKDMGFDDPIFASISIALTNFLFSFVPFFLTDRIGRRNTLLRTTWILPLAMFISSIMYDTHSSTETQGFSTVNIIILICIVVYVAAYASGLGTVPWSSVELLPLEARAVGGTLITCCNWITNFIISLFYLSMMEQFSAGVTFGFFGVICCMSYLWTYKKYPDVNGIPLEEISKIFENGVDLKLADELRIKHYNKIAD